MKSIIVSLFMLFYFYSLNQVFGQQAATKEIIKRSAFTVLVTKCNVCHATKKKQDIFTLENMDSLSIAIKKQVFVKKKMPKGRKIKLTEEELKTLREWLELASN